MSKHTAGPWSCSVEVGAWVVSDSIGNPLAEFWRRGDTKMEEADAHLIASAPELLDALKNLLEMPNSDGTKEMDIKRLAIEISAAMAIGKAEGTL